MARRCGTDDFLVDLQKYGSQTLKYYNVNKKLFITLFTLAAVVLVALVMLKFVSCEANRVDASLEEEICEAQLLYGIEFENYTLESGSIGNGESMSVILGRYGVGAATVDRIATKAEDVFSLRKIRAGNNYTVFLETLPDSTARLAHFVYEQNMTDYMVISLVGDSIDIYTGAKDITAKRRVGEGTITSSLWNCMVAGDMSPALAMELSDIYAWTIDFFGIQEGDSFKLIYDERYVDSIRISPGRIWGAVFNHAGKDYYAIPFRQNGKISYWDEEGNSLRKNLLKAPLQYSRISSTFSNGRLHPILKIRRAHHGVDYAAPAGTPVVAIADGVVIFKGWGGGGGNTLKIKHSQGLTSGYLHLRGFAKGIQNGSRVSQGQLIGYVGSTGLSTGPHLDFRIWKNGTPIDPLKIPTEPAEPVAEANRAEFNKVRDLVLAELRGEASDTTKLITFDPPYTKIVVPAVDSLTMSSENGAE